MHMSVYLSHVCGCLRRTGEDIRLCGSGVTSGYVSPSVGAGNHIVVPWESSKPSTAEPFLQSLNFLMRPRFNKTLMITILYSKPKNEQLHWFLGHNQEKGQPRRRPCEQQASAPGQPTQRGLSSKSFEAAWGGEGAELPLLKGSPQRMTPINTWKSLYHCSLFRLFWPALFHTRITLEPSNTVWQKYFLGE